MSRLEHTRGDLSHKYLGTLVDDSALLLSFYAAIADPDYYLQILDSYDTPSSTITPKHNETLSAFHSTKIEQLVADAKDGIESSKPSGEHVLLFNLDGKIKNKFFPRSQKLFGSAINDISDLRIQFSDYKRVKALLSTQHAKQIILPIFKDNEDSAQIAMMEKIQPSQDIRLTLLQPNISLAAEKTLSESFGVTASEIEVLRLLVAGNSAEQIAKKRGRNIETIRTQLKSLAEKLFVRGQVQLISQAHAVNLSSHPYHENFDGDILEYGYERVHYFEFGDPKGRHVIFFHSATEGPLITEAFARCLFDKKIRLISVARPGSGVSTNGASLNFNYENWTLRAYQLVENKLNLHPRLILAEGVGLPHALNFSLAHTTLQKIVAVNPLLPFDRLDRCRALPGRWKFFASLTYMSNHLIRGVIATAAHFSHANPRKHAESIVQDNVETEIGEVLREDIIGSLISNHKIGRTQDGAHLRGELEAHRKSWDAQFGKSNDRIEIMLIQGHGRYSISAQMLAELNHNLGNSKIYQLLEERAPLHWLHPEKLVEILDQQLMMIYQT